MDATHVPPRRAAEVLAGASTAAGPLVLPSDATPATTAQEAPVLTLPLEVVFWRPRPLMVYLIGAGGTGARIAPDVARLLSRGDVLTVIDPDRVEEKNLLRQHFTRTDVGRYKAEVVARRAALAAPAGVEVRTRIEVLATLDTVSGGVSAWGPLPALYIGAVDNRACRRMAAQAFARRRACGLWVDAGNALRGGQVGLMGFTPIDTLVNPNDGIRLPTATQLEMRSSYRNQRYPEQAAFLRSTYVAIVNTLLEQTPALLQPDEAAEAATPECGIRMDTQSLAANVMAYACTINLVSRFLDGLPISTGMAFFSTQNTMSAYPFISHDPLGEPHRSLVILSTTTVHDTVAAITALAR